MQQLADKTAIVVGCSPSIVAAIARALAEAGAAIACVDRNADFAEACAAWLEKGGATSSAHSGDVSDEADVQRVVDEVVAARGGIDILVNGAAIQNWKGLEESSYEEFRRHFEIIVGGAFLTTKYCAEHLATASDGGAIINIGSTEAQQGRPGNIGYGTSKGALLQLTRITAMELAERDIRVNALIPTGTDPTEGTERAAEWGVDWRPAGPPPRDDFTRGDVGIPLGRRPGPSEYGAAAVFLASPAARMITGTELRVDGGTSAKYWRWNPGMGCAGTG